MITRRALFVYNFGIALILVVIGAVSVYAVDVVQPARLTNMPTFDAEARNALAAERELEVLRTRALFYFDLARGLKKARMQDTAQLFYDMRTLAFIAAAMLAIGGLLVLAARPAKSRTG